jgi:predicted amidohydrolase
MVNRFNVALIQIDTQQDKAANLRKIGDFIDEAAGRGAQFVTMPEMCTFIGSGDDARTNAETVPGPTTEFMAGKAKEHKIWIHGGSFYEKIPGERRMYNTTTVYSPRGEIAAVYRKIHLYDVDVRGGVTYKESETIEPGAKIVSFDTDYCKMGLAICYDIRFPELYRILALRGVKVIFNPAEFALYTGKDHWESLIRARAIENQVYMVCADQIGVKPNIHTFGRSLVVDPWGNTIAKASDKEGILLAEIDMDYVDQLRMEVPCLSNRKPESYVWD